MGDQGSHFRNDAIKNLTDKFLIKHHTIPNNVLSARKWTGGIYQLGDWKYVKLVGEKKTDWDQHLFTVFFAYRTTFKVTTKHMPYQLVYAFQTMLPTEYIIPTYNNDVDWDYSAGGVLAARFKDLERVVETREDAHQANIKIQQQWPKWFQEKTKEKLFDEGDLVSWHPKGQNMKPGKLNFSWYGPYWLQYIQSNNIILLAVMRHYDKNAVIVNNNN